MIQKTILNQIQDQIIEVCLVVATMIRSPGQKNCKFL